MAASRQFEKGKIAELDSYLRCLHKFFNKTTNIIYKQESLADAKVSARQQCMYEGL